MHVIRSLRVPWGVSQGKRNQEIQRIGHAEYDVRPLYIDTQARPSRRCPRGGVHAAANFRHRSAIVRALILHGRLTPKRPLQIDRFAGLNTHAAYLGNETSADGEFLPWL